jgi:hypothetical protein
MTDFLPLILLFTAWIPIAAGIAWAFERKPRMIHPRRRDVPKGTA